MKVILAKSAGFCYGVRRAVSLAEQTAAEDGGCWMLGDLIHNAHVVEDLRRRGVRKTDRPEEIPAGQTVVLRSHGELRSVLEELEQRLRSALPGEQWEQVWRHTLLTAQLRDMAYADYFAEGFRLAQELYRHPGA